MGQTAPKRKEQFVLRKGEAQKSKRRKRPLDKDGAKSPAGKKKIRTEHPIRGEAKL
jgi:hypothetical protein